MPYTPVELRHVKLGRSLLGFKRDETERLLTDVADSFEDVWRERGELSDKVHELDERLAEIRNREALLSATLVAAEKSAVDSKDAAKREAELIIAEAHGEARSIMRAAQSERERLFAEARRVESLLRSALGIVSEGRLEPGTPEPGGTQPAGTQPAGIQPGDAPPAPASDDPGAPAAPPPALAAAPPPQVPTLPPAPEHWPKREDTREFAVVRADEPQSQTSLPEGAVPSLPGTPEPTAREFAWGD